jgi:hypothetical protein
MIRLTGFTLKEVLEAVIDAWGMEAVDRAIRELKPRHLLKSTGDAARDRVVSERLGLRV